MTATGGFADHFGPSSALYCEARPGYPPALFHFIAIIAPHTRLAWDCATGSGQAANGLAGRFTKVLATDPSDAMIAAAAPHPRVRYAVTAYDTGLEAGTVGAVTVAQALHWLDLDGFLREARRVLVPDGLLAAWCYSLPRVVPEVDDVTDHFYRVTLGSYWPPERRHVENGYQSIALPIDEYAVPPFEMVEDWVCDGYLAYVRSWSAVARCIEARGPEPVATFERALREAWGNPARTRRVRWPMHFRVGEVR